MREQILKLRMCEICQQTGHIEDLNKMIDTIKNCTAVEKYAYIIHDKDTDDTGALKAEHIHIMVKFSYSYNVATLAKQLGIDAQYVQKIQSKNYEDALLYLTHANAEGKYQYDSTLVRANFDYCTVCETYMKKKATVTNHGSEKEMVKQYCDDIVKGKIKRYNYFNKIDTDLCVRHRTRLESAFKVHDDILKTQERSLEVIFMTGDSGTGKTTLAKKIAVEQNYSYFVSSASNDILDSYAGQDCLILDDLRASSLGLSDLLKLLDNNTSSTAKSRYYNKILECKLIIITTIIDMDTFYSNVFEADKEPLTQLKRRCLTHFEFTKQEIRVSMYDGIQQDYIYVKTIQNPVASLYPSQAVDRNQATDKLKKLLGNDYVETSDEDWLKVEESPFPID